VGVAGRVEQAAAGVWAAGRVGRAVGVAGSGEQAAAGVWAAGRGYRAEECGAGKAGDRMGAAGRGGVGAAGRVLRAAVSAYVAQAIS